MLFQTHILIGVTFFLLARNFLAQENEVIFFLLVLLGSVLPDLDEPHSHIHRWSGPIGRVVAALFQHRGFFHSLFMYVGLFVVINYFFMIYYAQGLFLGYLAHFFGDAVTPMGIKPFYPFSQFTFRGPIRVGGWAEIILLLVLLVLVLRAWL